jgi:hypothetical protein
MANWVINRLSLQGDIGTIQKICETHFAITPQTDPNELDDIVKFPGVVYDNDRITLLSKSEDVADFLQRHGFSGEYNFGFNLLFGLTTEEAHGGMPGPRWQGEFGSPFHIEWCSKYYPNLTMMCGLGVQYPDIRFEYVWYELHDGYGGRNVWEGGKIISEDYDPIGGWFDSDPEEEMYLPVEYDDDGIAVINDDGTTTNII